MITEKEILVTAISYLLKEEYANTQEMFPKYQTTEDINHIDKILADSRLFSNVNIGNLVKGYSLIPVVYTTLNYQKDRDNYVEDYVTRGLDRRIDISNFKPTTDPKKRSKIVTQQKKERPKYFKLNFWIEEFIKKFIGWIWAGIILIIGLISKCSYEKWHKAPSQQIKGKVIAPINKTISTDSVYH